MVSLHAMNPPRFGKIAWSPEADNQQLVNALRNNEVVIVDVDTQNDFMFPNKVPGRGLYVRGAETLIANLKNVLSMAPLLKIPVVSTKDTHSPDDLELKTFPIHCIKGTHGWKKIKGTSVLVKGKKPYVISLDPKKKDVPSEKDIARLVANNQPIHIEKNTLSVWETARDVGGPINYVDWQPNKKAVQLFNTLHYAGRKVAVVIGVATEYCVKKAVEGLKAHGYTPIVVEDTVKPAATDQLNDPQDSVFKDTKVISTAQFVDLARTAAGPSQETTVVVPTASA